MEKFEVKAVYVSSTGTIGVYINDLPHLVAKGVIMYHAYLKGDKGYIECYTNGGHMTRMEYSSKDKWVAVLKELKKVI